MPTERIARHALEMLKQDDLWEWSLAHRIQASGKQQSGFETITPKFLHHLIRESLVFSDRVLERFWHQLGACDERLEQNIKTLKGVDFVSAKESFDNLFQGLDPKDIDFQPVLAMAAEYFTHLGVAFMDSKGKKSGTGTESAVDEDTTLRTDELIQELEKDPTYGKRRPILKTLAHRRDGTSCLLTHYRFKPFTPTGLSPVLTHIIPHSVHNKPDTLKCIAMFAGEDIRDAVTKHLNDLGNVMNMQGDAHDAYDASEWGIEAKKVGGIVRYFFRLVPPPPDGLCPDIIRLRDGDEIRFGAGSEGHLEKPKPELCNLQLAVSRVMNMSGAADIVLKWKEDADDGGWDGHFIVSEEYCDMLDAKLYLSGRAVVA